jgi:hypothetical protein
MRASSGSRSSSADAYAPTPRTDPAVAIQPGVAGLDDPAACFPLGVVGLQVDLLTVCADVRRERVVADQLADFSVVIRLVQTDALRVLWGRLRPLDRD